jgi:hypothetical protein
MPMASGDTRVPAAGELAAAAAIQLALEAERDGREAVAAAQRAAARTVADARAAARALVARAEQAASAIHARTERVAGERAAALAACELGPAEPSTEVLEALARRAAEALAAELTDQAGEAR